MKKEKKFKVDERCYLTKETDYKNITFPKGCPCKVISRTPAVKHYAHGMGNIMLQPITYSVLVELKMGLYGSIEQCVLADLVQEDLTRDDSDYSDNLFLL